MRIYKDKYGVPYLTNEQIEIIGEYIINKYDPTLFSNPRELDVEHFIENFLNAQLDFQYLSHNGCYLGMTVFEDSQIAIFDLETQAAKYIDVDKDTIILDARVLEDEHTFQFTSAHECGHEILHKSVYMKPAIQCRRTKVNQYNEAWPKERIVEYQANALGATLLMPKRAVAKVVSETENNMAAIIIKVSEIFNVSLEAALYRLKVLDFIPKEVDYDMAKGVIDDYRLRLWFEHI